MSGADRPRRERPPVHLVGLGADGWAGLAPAARAALDGAAVVVGAPRQLQLLPEEVSARRVPWPSPLPPAVAPLVAAHGGDPARPLAVLASGDPMHYGIGRLLVRHVGVDRLVVHPHPSSISLACARLGWPVEDVDVVSAVGRDVRGVGVVLHPGRRLLVLSAGPDTPGEVARLLTDRGFGASAVSVLGDLGSAHETRVDALAWELAGDLAERAELPGELGEEPARERPAPSEPFPALNVVAIATPPADAIGSPGDAGAGPRLGLVPGLPDDAYGTDGQLTKWEVRAVTLAALAPAPGELLLDIGGGTGTIGIEWMRAHRACRAIAVERREERARRIADNAAALGVPGLRVVLGRAPEALEGLPTPDAVFVGGGLSREVFEACWAALRPGGRFVANTVTLESEALLVALAARAGGRLTRIEISRAEPIGGYTGWRPARPVTQWSATKSDQGAS